MNPTQNHKDWANFLRNRIGGKVSVTMYDDEERATRIPIFSGETEGGIVGATIGLMDYEQSRNSVNQLRTEILVDSHIYDERVLNVLSTIAFYVMKNKWRVRPGTIFEDMLPMYFPDTALPHIYFTAPYQWRDMNKVELGDKVIYPLLAIPISAAEANLASQNAGRSLESLWSENQTQVLDWSRNSSL